MAGHPADLGESEVFSMSVKKFDLKELMVKHGERIGLGVAVGIMAILCIAGLTSAGPDLTPEKINQSKQQAAQTINSATVDPDKVKPPKDLDPEGIKAAAQKTQVRYADRSHLFEKPSFERAIVVDRLKGLPKVLPAAELTAINLNGAFLKYDVRGDVVQIITQEIKNQEIVEKEPPKGTRAHYEWSQRKANEKRKEQLKQILQSGILPGAAGSEGGDSYGLPSVTGGSEEYGTTPPKTESSLPTTTGKLIPRRDLKPQDIMALQLHPFHSVMIVGSFPLQQQMEMLRKSLHLPKDQVPPLLFRGLEVQRRYVFPKGTRLANGEIVTGEDMIWAKPEGAKDWTYVARGKLAKTPKLDGEVGWQDLDIKKVSGAVVGLAIEFAEETDETMWLLQAASSRLKMILPKLERGKYPNAEEIVNRLPLLKKTYDELKASRTVKLPPAREDPRLPSKLENFDPFEQVPTVAPGTLLPSGEYEGGEPVIPPDRKPFIPGKPSEFRLPATPPAFSPTLPSRPAFPAFPPATRPGTTTYVPGQEIQGEPGQPVLPEQQFVWPEYCLIRFVDLDPRLRPGTTLEYRVRIVLQNPNYQNEGEVADPAFAKDELLKSDWSAPTQVTLPEDLYLYAGERVADEKEPKEPKEPKPKKPAEDKGTAPVEIVKWLSAVNRYPTKGNGSPVLERVGEWWVERTEAVRGDYIGRLADSALVIWDPTMVLPGALRPGGDRLYDDKTKVRTDAFYTRRLLVDYETAGSLNRHFSDQIKKSPSFKGFTDDQVPVELLVMEPDGRLVAKHAARNRENPTRQQYVEKWEKWFAEVKTRSKPPKDPKDPNKPGEPIQIFNPPK